MAEFQSKLDLQFLSQIADFIEKTAHAMGCTDPHALHDLQLAISEASTNIIQHGNPVQDTFTICLEKKAPDCIQVKIIDHGKPFDFKSKKLPDPALSIDEKINQGFGIGFIKAITEQTSYDTYPNKNILSFSKTFQSMDPPVKPGDNKTKNARRNVYGNPGKKG